MVNTSVRDNASLKDAAHILLLMTMIDCACLLEKFLSQYFIVSVAANGEQAMALVTGYQFDLAIIDIMMPDQSGIELIQHIPCPALFLSALGAASQRIDRFKSRCR